MTCQIDKLIENEIFQKVPDRKDKAFIEYVEIVLSRYSRLVAKTSITVKNRHVETTEINKHTRLLKSVAKEMSELLINAIKDFCKGNIIEAIYRVTKAIELDIKYTPKDLDPDNLFIFPKEGKTNQDMKFYKMRKMSEKDRENDVIFKKKDLFHIPFEHNFLVSNNRFSMDGVPCIYLGTSIRICHKEIDSDAVDLSNMWVSQYQIGRTLRNTTFAYFVNRPTHIHFNNPALPSSDKLSYILHWPIHFLCSIPKQHDDKPFVPEYIIPQLLLNCISMGLIEGSDGKYIGAAYMSTKENNLTADNADSFINVAIPVRTYENSGFCTELVKYIKLTEPVNTLKCGFFTF
jgi:hypothetical protein